ncbi:MAG TPA: cyclase family protein [Pyrinomonadaceae bacterium]|jgi:kynurenine formamidase|nr:cyclase family protein [Pyrinomonadaceae bacterium]
MKRLGLLCSLALVTLALASGNATIAQERTAGVLAGTIVDLSYPFDAATIYWPTAATFQLEKDFEGTTEQGYYYSAYRYSAAEHGGTHIDAPVHFAKGRNTVNEIPVEQLIGPGIVVDVTRQCAGNADYLVSESDFKNWERRNGRISPGTIVLLRTGFGKFYPDRLRYLGTDQRGAAAVANLHFPGLDPNAARWLTQSRNIRAVGLDTASIDYGQSKLFESHRTLFARNIPAFENVANLDKLPAKGFSVIALPMKIKGGSGGPLRIIAVIADRK